MTDQPGLFSIDPTMADKFDEFHRSNPHVYMVLVRLAREWVRRTGTHRLGIKTLYERARWEIAISTSDPDFKLNNNFTAYYARLIMIREADLWGMFELRRSAADEVFGRIAS